MDTNFDLVALQKQQPTTKSHKIRPTQFVSVAAGVQKRLETNIKNRKSSRLSVLDRIRNIAKCESPKAPALSDAQQKALQRKQDLEKWKEEKNKKLKEAAAQKKKPFVAGMSRHSTFGPPPPPPKPMPSTSRRVTSSQARQNTERMHSNTQTKSFAPSNTTFKPHLFLNNEVPKLVPVNKKKASKSKPSITFEPVLWKNAQKETRSTRTRAKPVANKPIEIKASKSNDKTKVNARTTKNTIQKPPPLKQQMFHSSSSSSDTEQKIPKSESSSEEKLRFPKLVGELAPEQIIEQAKNFYSPCVTMSRGKANARKEMKKKLEEARGTWSSGEASPGLSDEECGGGGAGETPAALLARVRALGRRGLHAEYEEICARAPTGTFINAKLPSNLAKNRYTDVLCFDHSRVLLSQTDPDDPTTDYINANYVDGYKQKNAFICTQGDELSLLPAHTKPHSTMSLETLCVKTEAGEVSVKEEAEEECDNEETGAHVKEEAECEDSAGLCELYADHQIKDELVLGPVELKRPCVTSTHLVAVSRAEQARGRACSVRLERLLVDAARRSCRVGLHTYTLRRTREPQHCTDTYQCDECGKQFTNKLTLRKHIHSHLSETRSFNKSALSASLKPTGEKPFKCSHCDYKSSLKSFLVRHETTHTGEKRFKCSHCDYKSSWKSNLVIHEIIHTGEKPFKCSQCDYKSSRKSTLVSHKRMHTGEKPFKCSHCDYKSSLKSTLVSHERMHTGEKPFKCSHCDYKSSQKSTLVRHERMHTGEKPFKCSHCDYKSSRKSTLVRHERLHTGEKPFKCSHCDYKSSLKSTLVSHERIHTGEKRFKCSHCDYKSNQKSHLVIHMRMHTGEKPFKCSQCDYKSSLKSTLVRHVRLHTGEKPFKCSHCDYKSSLKSTLVSHERIHTGEKPFKCSHCDYKSNQKSHLACHRRIHIGEKF